MTAYYNEIDPYCAQWLRNLIAAGALLGVACLLLLEVRVAAHPLEEAERMTLSNSIPVGGFPGRLPARFLAHCYPTGVLFQGVNDEQ